MKVLSLSHVLTGLILFSYLDIYSSAQERKYNTLRSKAPPISNNTDRTRNSSGRTKKQSDETGGFQITKFEELEKKNVQKRETNVFKKSRVIGGNDAQKNTYKYMVNLISADGTHNCGGSLIAKDLVLTAAHCYGHFEMVQIGRYNIADESEEFETLSILSKFVHTDYDSNFLRNDVMLLLLNEPSSYPIVSLDRDQNIPQSLAVIGWGVIDPSGAAYEGKLQEVLLNSITNEECRLSEGYVDGKYGSYYGLIKDSMMCTSAEGKDSCYGDSGGPLLKEGGEGESDVQVGIVSWGFGCAHPAFPGVYSRVKSYIEWIDTNSCILSKHLSNEFNCQKRNASAKADTCTKTRSSCKSGFQCKNDVCISIGSRKGYRGGNDI